MNAGDLRAVVLVLLALVAVGAAASTLDAGGEPSAPPDPPEEPAESGPELDDGVGIDGIGSGIDWPSVSCPSALTDPRALGGLVCALLALGGAAYRARRTPFVPVVVVGPVLVGVVSLCGAATRPWNPLHAVSGLLSAPVLLGSLLATVGAVLGILYVVTGADERLEPDPYEEDAELDLAAVGDAAGAAADRIDRHADVTNEVYRAWREMTTHLAVPNAEATTSSEFADAAIEAGMDSDDVGRLTRLFEEVRYGDRDPGAREERAVNALRRIERAHGDDPP